MADNININTGTSGVYVKTKEIAAGTHAGFTILCNTAGAAFGTAAAPIFATSVGTADVNVVAFPAISGTVTALPSGTQACSVAATVPVSGTFYQATQPISGTIAVSAITTGTVSVVGTPAITGTVTALAAGTQIVQGTANANRIQTYVVATTSGTIVYTSGGNTIYVTDAIFSVPTPNNISLASAATTMTAPFYFAGNGGGAFNFVNPLVCTSAQSLTVLMSSSGTCGVTVIGYTVT